MINTPKLPGDSPLKLIMVTFIIVFFVALFAWQIEKYLAVSVDSVLQGEITKMNTIIEADSLDDFEVSKYAYLHEDNDLSKALKVNSNLVKFKPKTTLNNLLAKSYIIPSGPPKDFCYLYIYFPPGAAQKAFDFYDKRTPGYVLAAWSELKQSPIVVASANLNQWAKTTLKVRDFQCHPDALEPNILPTDNTGKLIELPGIYFQFKGYYYTKVKR